MDGLKSGHTSLCGSAGSTTTFRLSISFKIYKCQSMSFIPPVYSHEPAVQVKSRPEKQSSRETTKHKTECDWNLKARQTLRFRLASDERLVAVFFHSVK